MPALLNLKALQGQEQRLGGAGAVHRLAEHASARPAWVQNLSARSKTSTIVARHSTRKIRHGVLTRVSKAVSNEIAKSDGGNRQISAGAPHDTPKFCK